MKIQHLVVDSGAFIKNAPVHEYAENIYTVGGVIKEIRDNATRERLQFLPYQLKVKEPSPEAYKHVLDFSKKTGDFPTLSATDIQIIALTYQLEKENVGTKHLHEEPSNKVTAKPCFAHTQLSGFYYPKKATGHSEDKSSSDSVKDVNEDESTSDESVSNKDNEISENVTDNDNEISENVNDKEDGDGKGDEISEDGDDKEDEISEDVDVKEKKIGEERNGSENDLSEDGDDKENEISEDEEDSEEGWITSSNITEMQKKMGAMVLDKDSSVCVACISTDFAIQNTLLQIGLHILSVDGMLIKNVRVFILRCFACYKTTTNFSKQFCPNCGNKTLKRVAVSYNEEGTRNIHVNFKRPINIRGTRYSLPTPRGGKHAVNPILVEDQRVPHNRPPKMALRKMDVLSTDYDSLSSPFAINDVYSRAASLGIRPNKSKNQKKNPNEWSIRTGNRKRHK